MEVKVLGYLTKEYPPDLSDEDHATKKVCNKDVELGDKVLGMSFRDTLMGNIEQNEDNFIAEVANFVIEDTDIKLLHDDGLPAILFLDRAQN